MRMPKILPWLARRATVSDSRAALLWDEACRQAAAVTGERDTSCYWGAAQQNFLYLLEKERWRSNPPLVWPWLLLHDGLECWSRLAKRWLAPVSAAVSAWPASAGGTRTGGRGEGHARALSRMPFLPRLVLSAARPRAAVDAR